MGATHVHNQTNTLRFCREDNPLYVFTLWSKHRDQCRRCHRRSKKGRKRPRRNQQILGSLCGGWSAKKVADEYRLSYSWAKKLCKRLLGESGERKPGSGRPMDRWKKIIWSDESPFVLRCQRRSYVWRLRSEQLSPRCL